MSPIGSSEIEKTYFERVRLSNGELKMAELVALKWSWTCRTFFLVFLSGSIRCGIKTARLILSLVCFLYGSGTEAPNHHLLSEPHSLFTTSPTMILFMKSPILYR